MNPLGHFGDTPEIFLTVFPFTQEIVTFFCATAVVAVVARGVGVGVGVGVAVTVGVGVGVAVGVGAGGV